MYEIVAVGRQQWKLGGYQIIILAGNELLSTTSPSLRSGTPPFQGGEFFVNHKRRILPSGNYRNKSPVKS